MMSPIIRRKDAEKRLHFRFELIETRQPFFAELSCGLAAFDQIHGFPETLLQ